jgi:uncharacterized protein YbbC (DUF1343 family)
MKPTILPGIDSLLSNHGGWLAGMRVGLVSNIAATDSRGRVVADRLWADDDVDLTCLFGPEHGFTRSAAAGAHCPSADHTDWRIPVYSLYGDTRKPTPAMLSGLDIIIFDLQDIGARSYTYVSSLRLIMEAAADAGKGVIVADRPVPLPNVTDGPITEPAFASFVALEGLPMSYGMTPGEAALWIKSYFKLDVTVQVARVAAYARESDLPEAWPWLPPSPAMLSWDTAMCFPATVCFEGLPAIDHGRKTGQPFQLLGSPWTRGAELCDRMADCKLPGITFSPHTYRTQGGAADSSDIDGMMITITAPHSFRPILTAVSLVQCLQELYGIDKTWTDARPEFFDKLFGTDSVRKALLDGQSAPDIAREWQPGLHSFDQARSSCMIYTPAPEPE